jgi:hypothetical protein
VAGALAVSGVAVTWLTIGLVTSIALLAMLIALVRHGILIGRTAARFQEEISPITEEIAALGAERARLSARLSRGSTPRRR